MSILTVVCESNQDILDTKVSTVCNIAKSEYKSRNIMVENIFNEDALALQMRRAQYIGLTNRFTPEIPCVIYNDCDIINVLQDYNSIITFTSGVKIQSKEIDRLKQYCEIVKKIL